MNQIIEKNIILLEQAILLIQGRIGIRSKQYWLKFQNILCEMKVK
jgi:hypothetical protein